MKKFAAPLQALAALLLCSGMAWMVFVLSSVNPNPPTAIDLTARSTQDMSFANMNSTAVALAKEMLAKAVPSPSIILLPVTGRETATPTPGAVVTLKAIETSLETPTPFSHWITATATRKKQERPPAPTIRPSKTSLPTRTLVTPTKTSLPTQMPTPTVTLQPSAIPEPTEPPATNVPATTTLEPTTDPPPTDPPHAVTDTPAPLVVTTEPPTQPTP